MSEKFLPQDNADNTPETGHELDLPPPRNARRRVHRSAMGSVAASNSFFNFFRRSDAEGKPKRDILEEEMDAVVKLYEAGKFQYFDVVPGAAAGPLDPKTLENKRPAPPGALEEDPDD